MCGITGFINSTSHDDLDRICAAMTATLHHRGPDSQGTWSDPEAGVVFGHARLAVIDLSSAGQQPMISRDERWVITYNGEVYNAPQLRTDLESRGISFRGHSDTEVILEAVAIWGVEEAARKLNGMFAIALWDRRDQSLYLVRDRLGIKPLYWAKQGSLFLFGSELKALRAHPKWQGEVDRNALTSFMRYGYVPAPGSIYCGVRKLPPAHILVWKKGGEPREFCYWSMRDVAIAGQQQPQHCSDNEAIVELEQLLRDAVAGCMASDVPLGSLLSGGIDSTVVTALMQAQSSEPIHTFSIGFDNSEYDEARYAKAIAAHLGTMHTELYVEPDAALNVIPRLAEFYDEPFADSSQIPSYLISELTREHVTVALSGDGGDELFAGYNRYLWAERVLRTSSRLPESFRHVLSRALQLPPPRFWTGLFGLLPRNARPAYPADKVSKLAGILLNDGMDAAYRHLTSVWQRPANLVIDGSESGSVLDDRILLGLLPDNTARMQYLDSVTYLPDDILTKLDRASMAVSLEARVPLLDHRVVEFAWRQPVSRKIRKGEGKWMLRKVLEKYVPPHLTERPKMGFSPPLDQWLRGPLREWAESLLDEGRLKREGFLNPAPVKKAWQQHISGRQNCQHKLWPVLMFEAWLERERSG